MSSLRVKVLRQNGEKVTIKILVSNTSFPISKQEFNKKVENGVFEVV